MAAQQHTTALLFSIVLASPVLGGFAPSRMLPGLDSDLLGNAPLPQPAPVVRPMPGRSPEQLPLVESGIGSSIGSGTLTRRSVVIMKRCSGDHATILPIGVRAHGLTVVVIGGPATGR